ncbi:MAG: hypothetical protein IT373_20125 [Polyangiaceae bacterium]|nr:hypothetical protein [Polyangiaceae bacterium]
MTAPLELRDLDRRHGARMLQIDAAAPIEADVTLRLARDPAFFAWPDAVFDDYAYVGGFRGGTLCAYGVVGFARGFTGGACDCFCYAGDARVLPEARGEAFTLRALSAAAAKIAARARIGYALVAHGNRPAERVMARVDAPGITFEPLTSFEAQSIVLLGRPAAPPGLHVRPARPDDADDLAVLMQRAYAERPFAPLVTADELRQDCARLPGFGLHRYLLAFRGRELVGALGLWDAGPVRRAIVLRYSPFGQLLRVAHGAVRVLSGAGAAPPRPGQPLLAVTATRVAVPSDDPRILRALLAAAVGAHIGRYHLLHIGFVGGEPLARATRGWLVHRMRSQLFALRVGGATLPRGRPYVDLRFL